ncbi:MAG: Cytochrome b/b6 domain protein [Myxococcales bacterium]|nr:Cytochrome b/b6 domain protein [Myxococcales bacterium]
MKLKQWFAARTGFGAGTTALVVGGPSFAYVFGWVLALMLAVEAVTGTALAAFYSPSTTNAWASVAYIQDQMSLGWLVRGLHYHGASALVIISGMHLVQTAFYGAYKKPRELTWWLGIVLLLLILGFAISGFVLRWDQAGYWANRVEIGIAASTPVVGPLIRKLVIGGNEYGNLTLTRFYALHIVVLPGIGMLCAIGHVFLARRQGVTALRPGPSVPRWPAQTVRNVTVMAAAFACLVGFTVARHGADLAAPADPAAAYDARPLWYFRWLFELRHLAGSAETIAALVAPAIVLGFLAGLPMLDRGSDLSPRKRLPWVAGSFALFGLIGVLTLASFASDAADPDLTKREDAADALATKMRRRAREYGVPASGPADINTLIPMWRARTLYAARCSGCHDVGSKDRKGPVIEQGHGNRAWLAGFLADPSGDHYWGKTKLGTSEDAMKPVPLPPPDLDALVEILYAETGAPDVDPFKRDRGKLLFDKACSDCHSLDEGVAGASGPGLGRIGSRDYFTSFIANPKSPVHMGTDRSEMPRFDRDLSLVDRDAIAEYLVWLRTATKQDLDALEPLP